MASSKNSLPGEGGKYFSLRFSVGEVRKGQLFGAAGLVRPWSQQLEREWPH